MGMLEGFIEAKNSFLEACENAFFSFIKLKRFLFNERPATRSSCESRYQSLNQQISDDFLKNKMKEMDKHIHRLKGKNNALFEVKNKVSIDCETYRKFFKRLEKNVFLEEIRDNLEPLNNAKASPKKLPVIDIENFPRLSACKLFFFSPRRFLSLGETGTFLRKTLSEIADYKTKFPLD